LLNNNNLLRKGVPLWRQAAGALLEILSELILKFLDLW